MEILRAIDRADALCPNPYTQDEKICWCDEVTAQLRRNVIKIYDVIEAQINGYGELSLPGDISFDRVEMVYVDGTRLNKQDFRSFAQEIVDGNIDGDIVGENPKRLRVVYLTMPKPTRTPDIRGEFNTGTDIIEIKDSPFIEGDKIEIASLEALENEPDWNEAVIANVMEIRDDMILLDGEVLQAQTEAPLAIRRVVDDFTAIDEAPYDSMYIEYILAKMALYQHDYTGYNAHMTQYNSLFEALRREVASRRPLNNMANFRNYSCI